MNREPLDVVNMVLSGLGGQGILFATRVLAQGAMARGMKVLGAETHGMAQRGGSVVSHLRFGEVHGSLVRTGTAHVLLGLEEHEAYRCLPFLARGGRMYVNVAKDPHPRPEVRSYLDRMEMTFRGVQAGHLAAELGAPMASNLALLGYYSAFEEIPVGHQELAETIRRISPERFREANLRVFTTCYEYGCRQSTES